ncbi:MAG: TetR/AcrR family transcriptional regulator [Rhodobiaceae bacterium]|nr:TetR/AcrR family transcriptional regulator [Rhodobiaceae bacterium]
MSGNVISKVGSIDLDLKKRPLQKRAQVTYDKLLNVAALLLEAEGVERISTNMIAERANVTVPALYRYFPYKYALLRALADKLSESQLALVHKWAAELSVYSSVQAAESIHQLIAQLVDVTAQQPGSLAVMRASSAVPILRERRLTANRDLTNIISTLVAPVLPNVCPDKIWTKVRVSIEFGYTAIELALEEEISQRDDIMSEAASGLIAFWAVHFLEQTNENETAPIVTSG